MDAEVKVLLNKTLGGYSDDYRRNIRRVITGTLDEAVRPDRDREQYEHEARLPVFVTDATVAALAAGITVTRTDTTGRARTWVLPGLGIAPWLQRTMGLRIREALDTNPRELASISQVLGHDSVQTTLRFYIHPSANAEQRISAMMNTRWTTPPGPAAPR